MDLGGIIIAALAGATAVSPLAVYLGLGWRNEAREHRRALNERDIANDAVLIAQGRAEAAGEALSYSERRLSVARQHITDIEPLADKGRKLVARRHAQNVARKAKRAGR